MKKLIVISALLCAVLTLSAATVYVGAEGGVTFNTVLAAKGYRDYSYSPAAGYKVSVPVVVTFNDNMGLETGLAVYAKNHGYSQTVSASGTRQTNFDLSISNGFVILPLLFRFSIPVKQFDIYASVGGFAGCWVYARKAGFVLNGNAKKENVDTMTDLSLYNRIDAGVSAKLGCDINFTSFQGYIQGEYDLSLTDMNRSQKHGGYITHNSTFCVTLGILWGINK